MEENEQENKTALVDIKDDQLIEIIDQMDDDTKNALYLTDKEIIQLRADLKRNVLSETYHSPMICKASDCVMAKRCPLEKIGKAPLAKVCPVELMLVNRWKDEYIHGMDVDWSDRVDRMQVIELIEIDLVKNRASNMLAEHGLTQEVFVGIDDTGSPVNQTIVNLAFEVKQTLSNRRSKVLKEMIATRESKAKFLKDVGRTPDEYAASLRERAEELEKKHVNDKIIDAEEIIEITEEPEQA